LDIVFALLHAGFMFEEMVEGFCGMIALARDVGFFRGLS